MSSCLKCAKMDFLFCKQTMYGRMEEADALIESLGSDKVRDFPFKILKFRRSSEELSLTYSSLSTHDKDFTAPPPLTTLVKNLFRSSVST